MTILALARKEIRELQSYVACETATDTIRLNANESPLAIGSGVRDGLNRYPDSRPARLTRKLAAFYGVGEENILVTRGSSEGIDLLIRTFCSAGRDEVLLTPPVFEMYQVYASIQGAATIHVPLLADRDFFVDTAALIAAATENTKLIFLCSPNNPVGTTVPRAQILQILKAMTGRSVVVIDEAYIEYSETDSLAALVSEHENLVVLRTLSKGLALAGARCGALVGSPELISLLDRVLAPYAMSSPAVASAEQALTDERLLQAQASIQLIVAERERLRDELNECDAVDRIWPSRANFLFVRFKHLNRVTVRLADAGISIRTFDDSPMFDRCARISIGAEPDNDRLLDAIRDVN